MEVTYDSEADAAYILIGAPIGEGQVSQQVHSIKTPEGKGEISLDFDADGRLLGVEVLFAASVLSPEVLEKAKRIDG